MGIWRVGAVGRILGFAMLLVVASLSSGCGVILGGKNQNVTFNTTPSGATVTLLPSGNATTPASVKLSRKNRYTVNISMAGYQPAKVSLERKMRVGVLVADIALCCVAPIVDAITGGWYKLTPETVDVSLTKVAAVPGPDSIQVGLVVDDNKDGAELRADSSVPGVRIEIVRRE